MVCCVADHHPAIFTGPDERLTIRLSVFECLQVRRDGITCRHQIDDAALNLSQSAMLTDYIFEAFNVFSVKHIQSPSLKASNSSG